MLELQDGKRPADEMMAVAGNLKLTENHRIVALLQSNRGETTGGQTKQILSSDPGKGHLAIEISSHGDIAPGMTIQVPAENVTVYDLTASSLPFENRPMSCRS